MSILRVRVNGEKYTGYRTCENDIPSDRFLEPVPSGPQKGSKLDREKFRDLLKSYYEKRGCDINSGIPTRKSLEALGLRDVSDGLEKGGRKNVY